MIGRRNPFDAVFRLRAVRERRSRGDLGRARVAEAVARIRLEELRQRHRAAPLTATELLTPAELLTLYYQGIRSAELLNDAAVAYAMAREQTKRRITAWTRDAAELDSAEELRARRREQAAHEARLLAERSLDDLMAILRQRTEGP